MTDKETEALPKWLQQRFGQLWEKFEDKKTFSLLEAAGIVGESKEVTAVILSRLRRSGWVSTDFDGTDYRKSVYTLRNPAQIFAAIRVENTKDAQNSTS